MDDKELLESWRKANRIASKLGFKRYADDIAQEVVIDILRGRNASVYHLVIDSIRVLTKSSKRTRSYEQKLALFHANKFSELEDWQQDALEFKYLSNLEPKSEEHAMLMDILSFVNPKTRSGNYIIKFLEGHTQKEMGEWTGVSESRVSQMMKDYLQKCYSVYLDSRQATKKRREIWNELSNVI